MKILFVIALFFNLYCYSQIDTVVLNTKQSSFSRRQIKCILFNDRQCSNSLSDMNLNDRNLYMNEDTIYFKIMDGSNMMMQGSKLPNSYAIGPIIYFKNNQISKIENRTTGGHLENDFIRIYYGSESGYVNYITRYKKNEEVRKNEFELVLSANGKICTKKTKFKKLNNDWVLRKTKYCNCRGI